MKKINTLIYINLLFILTSLAIISIGASLCASFSCYYKILKKEDFKIKDFYFKSFKTNFFKSIIISIIFYSTYYILFRLFLIKNPRLLFITTALFIVIYMYSLSLLSRYVLNINDIIKNSILISIINGMNTLILLLFIYIFISFFLLTTTNILTTFINIVLFLGYMYLFAKLTINVYIEKFESIEN